MSNADVTQILAELEQGDASAAERLMPLVYDELRALAGRWMQRERNDHTLQATALVNEAYLRLVDQDSVQWRNRTHFFAVAAQAIRRILVDHARSHGRLKRGGDRRRLSLDEALVFSPEQNADLVDLDEALERLAASDPDKARVVELRFFAGLTSEEAADVLDLSARSVERYWQYARAWLYREMTTE